jgi:UDP-N-acetylmuramoyl-tripeptide--D-alanyl-D-alanine ligase
VDYRALNVVERGFSGVAFDLQHGSRRRRIDIAVPGAAGLYNALATLAVATELGLSEDAIDRGLRQVQPAPGRGRIRHGHRGARIVDDSYNANPEAMLAALRVLGTSPGRRVFVFGAMRELGVDSDALHRQVAEQAVAQGVNTLITVGPEAYVAGAVFAGDWQHYDAAEDLVAELPSFEADHTVLVKGSRSVGLESVVDALSASEGEIAC